MKLIDTGQSFAEAHPILGVLTSPILYCLAFVIVIVCLSVYSIIYNKEASNKYAPIYVLYLIFLTTISLYLVVASFLLTYRMSYEPTYTYHGDIKIINVSPMDEQGKREVTIKCDDTIRLLKLDDSKIDNIKKGDNASIEVKYNKNALDNSFFKKNSEKPKRRIDIKKMKDLTDAEIYKNNLENEIRRTGTKES